MTAENRAAPEAERMSEGSTPSRFTYHSLYYDIDCSNRHSGAFHLQKLVYYYSEEVFAGKVKDCFSGLTRKELKEKKYEDCRL